MKVKHLCTFTSHWIRQTVHGQLECSGQLQYDLAVMLQRWESAVYSHSASYVILEFSPVWCFSCRAVAKLQSVPLLTEPWPGQGPDLFTGMLVHSKCLYLWNKHSPSFDWNFISCSGTVLHINKLANALQELFEIELVLIKQISHVRTIRNLLQAFWF